MDSQPRLIASVGWLLAYGPALVMSGLSIRRLDERELGLLEPLWNALREHHAKVAPDLGPPRERGASWDRRRAQYEVWLAAPDAFVLIAERSGEAVGYAMVHLRDGSPTWPLSEGTGELETLSVHPDERGRGTGTALLDAVREHLRAANVTELSLHVLPTNADAIRFYNRHGFDTFGLFLRASISTHRTT